MSYCSAVNYSITKHVKRAKKMIEKEEIGQICEINLFHITEFRVFRVVRG